MKILTKIITLVAILLISIYKPAVSQQWTLAGTVPSPGLTPSISVVDANIAWIAGGTANAPAIFRTSNGGVNWTLITTNGTVNELFCIWAISATSAIVGEGALNSYAKLYKFASDGSKWNVVLQTGQNDGGFNNIIFSRSNPLIGGTLADEIYVTTNGGNNWTMKSTGVVGVSSAQNSLMFIDQNFFGFGLKNGASRVRMSPDGGVTWSTKNLNLSGNYTSGFTFKSDKMIGLSSTSSSMPYIARTTDGGTTWNTIDIGAGLSGTTTIKWVPGTTVVYILGSNGAIKRSTNDGLTWVSLPTAGVTGLNHFDFNKVNNVICGYAVSTNGSVIRLQDSILYYLTGVGNSGEAPSKYQLYQNYPNPFNPSTTIKFTVPEKSNVVISLFDITGREIMKVIENEFSAGNHEIQFNAEKLSSGTYFYRIKAGSFTDVKQMVLIK